MERGKAFGKGEGGERGGVAALLIAGPARSRRKKEQNRNEGKEGVGGGVKGCQLLHSLFRVRIHGES